MAECILLLAPLVIVPLGMSLILAAPQHNSSNAQSRRARISLRWLWVSIVLAAAALLISFAVPQSTVAMAFAAPWLFVTLALSGWGALRFVKQVRAVDSQLCISAALIFIAVGGGWTLLSRGGMRPLGFSGDIVLLTGAHFHYAGFALPLLAAMTTNALPSRLNVPMILGIVIGVPLVGAGITVSQLAGAASMIEAVSALILVAACLLLVVQQLRAALRAKTPTALALLAVSSFSLLAGMLLATTYAIGRYLSVRWLDIPTMVPLHGLTNAVGFAFCGMLGWLTERIGSRQSSATAPE